jgi:two-component system sensor histidine kinase KdpD
MPILIDDARLLADQLAIRIEATQNELALLDTAVGIEAGPTLEAAATVIAALESPDDPGLGEAAEALAAEVAGLEQSLATARDELVAMVATAGSQAGRLATAARFMVALGIPGTALLSWGAFARRRRRRADMEAALEHERELNRSKDQLIANISHELRTPLTGIYASARTMADTGHDPDLVRELTTVIVEQSGELKRMVEDLLVSAQADAERLSLALQEVDVVAAAGHVAEESGRTGHHIEVDCEAGMVVADPLRLRQVLRNLISNARNHGGDRTWIEGEPFEGGYRLAVIDDGGGVPDEIESRLFTPFVHRGDQPLITGSVGLGLSITKLLSEAMGGTIAYARDEETTRFVVELPGPPSDPSPGTEPELIDEEGSASEEHAEA